MNYYNENDRNAAEWLRMLIVEGYIPMGDIDERSVEDVEPADLDGYTQCHFFAGIGGWPFALRIAGWPDDRPVWTGSCPCQPFSSAGKRKGAADERHLWPAFHWLIGQRQPAIVFGEQVASKAGRAWWAGVQVDLEELGYDAAAADLCAAGVGAPHIRQRLFWVGHTISEGLEGHTRNGRIGNQPGRVDESSHGSTAASGRGNVGMANPSQQQPHRAGGVWKEGWVEHSNGGGLGGMANTTGDGRQPETSAVQRGSAERSRQHPKPERNRQLSRGSERLGWDRCNWIEDPFGKVRRVPEVESGIPLLVDGVSPFVAGMRSTAETTSIKETLRGLGNAIVPPLAAEFIKAYADIT